MELNSTAPLLLSSYNALKLSTAVDQELYLSSITTIPMHAGAEGMPALVSNSY